MLPVTAPGRLLVAATGSRLADEAAAVAVVLLVVARTGDARLAGLVVAAFALPTPVTGPVLGALLDRLRRPRGLFLANQVALAGALTGILALAGRAPSAVLVGLGLVAGLTAPILTGGYSALVPRAVAYAPPHPRTPPRPERTSLAPPHPRFPARPPDRASHALPPPRFPARPPDRASHALRPPRFWARPDRASHTLLPPLFRPRPDRAPHALLPPLFRRRRDRAASVRGGAAGTADDASTAVPAGGLARANALDAASYDVAGLGGPALVAVIASLAGAGPALAAAAALSAAGLVLVAAAPMPGPTADLAAKRSERSPAGATVAPTADPGKDPLLPALRDGLGLLWRARALRAATLATTVGYAAQGLLPVAFPLLAIHFGHPAAHGAWFLTAMSAGSLGGALASARLLARFRPIPVLGAALAGLGVALAGVAGAPTLPLALAAATAGGVAVGPMLAATLAVRQQSAPGRRYGQVVATAASIKVGAFALGAAATGPVTGWLPPRGVVLLVGLVQLVALLPLATVRPRLSTTDRDVPPRPDPADRRTPESSRAPA
ncbi:MFS transporter [Asanoa sp. WMMD1127]|uniref:MFS transporter n=1 Tax=Asanoa sp. WMMD1127 TaxID=3016107 RepID=UPI0024175160|nr:MFS transporter [Asanoa sp. WMMD1127]MDG4825860.1 MFS transporter [Asanoa sp. WMMD1127]